MLQADTCVITPIGLDHTEWLGDTHRGHRHGKGRHHPPRGDADLRRAAGRGDAPDTRALRRGRRHGCPRGSRVRRPTVATSPWAARCCRCRASAACTTRCSCRCTAHTRPRTRSWHSPPSRRSSARARALASSIRRSSARASPTRPHPAGLSGCARRPTILLDAAHNPHGMTATVTALQEEFAFGRLVAVLAVLARQGRRRACWSCSSR